MLHHLAGATIQIANLFNYNCHPLEDGKKANVRLTDQNTSLGAVSSRTILFQLPE